MLNIGAELFHKLVSLRLRHRTSGTKAVRYNGGLDPLVVSNFNFYF